jgi:hypothetical protein
MKSNIRKIIVGDSYSNCIRYVKGTEYRVGAKKCILQDFLPNEDKEGSLDIYVSDGKSTFVWKTIHGEPLEVEYDGNFE